MIVKSLHIYPIKSLGGISIPSAVCLERGMQYDRRMMLIDENGRFITQREFPAMALVGAAINEKGFTFFKKNKREDQIFIPHKTDLREPVPVSVWKHQFEANLLDSEFSQWFNDTLNINARLVRIDENCSRTKSLVKSPSKTALSLADGYPYLVISEASLRDLNRRLIVSVPMDRFRPNIVLEECQPYEEEDIDKFHIGEVDLRMIKACARCIMTTIDQKTGNKLVEPLKTLSSYKKQGNKIYFGMNAVVRREGRVSVGDEIIV